MQSSYDIIIVGAGVIGLTQAVALTAAGFKVAVVDAQAAPSLTLQDDFDVRVFALNRFSEGCLKKWGVWSTIESLRFAPYHQVSLMFQGAEADLIFDDHDDAEPNLGSIVEQSVWRQAAFEKLSTEARCDFFWQCRIQSIEYADSLLLVTFVSENDTSKTICCQTQLLVGADGIHSQVRALSGIATESYPCHQTAVVFTIRVAQSHQFSAAQYFCKEGIIAFLPIADPHKFSVVWSMPEDRLAQNALTDEALAALLNAIIAEKWGALSLVSQRFAFPLLQTQAAHYFSAHTVLIGDAAHSIHPLAGQGANLGVADIDALTARLLWAKNHERPIFDETVLRKYARARRSAAWQMMGLMNGFAQTAFLNPLLSLGSKAINATPGVKNILSRFALYQFTK